MKDTNELKEIRKVILKTDNKEYFIYTIYSKTKLSLCVYGYDDTEQDFQTDIKDIKLISDERGFKE